MASQCNGDYYIPLKIQYIYYTPFISLLYGPFIDIKYVTVTWTYTIQAYSKIENLKKKLYFLNKEISFDIY